MCRQRTQSNFDKWYSDCLIDDAKEVFGQFFVVGCNAPGVPQPVETSLDQVAQAIERVISSNTLFFAWRIGI